MSAMPHEPLSQAEVLLEGFLALDTPEGSDPSLFTFWWTVSSLR
ncbi:hypothetical protein [Streptomyces sp. OR43]|nr:hypothetical protein [Streptomyces sp. or43]